MVTYWLKGLELYDAITTFVHSRGGRITSPRGAREVRFELPAEKEEGVTADLELLGYAPQCVSRDLRPDSSEIRKVSPGCGRAKATSELSKARPHRFHQVHRRLCTA
jgi:hypothetical protein